MYNEIKNKKDKELKTVDEMILNSLSLNPINLEGYFSDFILKGKKLRPLFIFLICDLLNIKLDEKIYSLACAIELLHSASLIHDDILDNGLKRRNKPCIHLEHGNKTAVLAGDFILSLAMEFIAKTKNIKSMEILSLASSKMVKSELNSLEMRFKKPSIEFYIQSLREKTSALFVAAVECLENITGKKIESEIYEFSENFALCFQLRDDILNYLNKDEGKIASDEKEGIYTLPIILKGYGIMDGGVSFLDDLISKTKLILKKYSSLDIEKLTDCLNMRENDGK